VYKANQCDGLIAVGGGSAIDCAKGVAIAATHEGPLTHYATIEGGSPRITERVAPHDRRAHHQLAQAARWRVVPSSLWTTTASWVSTLGTWFPRPPFATPS
jgi:hypothetical protein